MENVNQVDSVSKALESVLALYRSSRAVSSVQLVCRLCYDCVEEFVPLTHLFWAIREGATQVRFPASIRGGKPDWLSERRLSKGEALTHVFHSGEILTSVKATAKQTSPELEEADFWILLPFVVSSGQVVGVLGASSDSADLCVESCVDLLYDLVGEVGRVQVAKQAIDDLGERERKRVLEQTGAGMLNNFKNLLGTIPMYVGFIYEELENEGVSQSLPKVSDLLEKIKETASMIRSAAETKLTELEIGLLERRKTRIDVIQLIDSVCSTITDNADQVYWHTEFSDRAYVMAIQQDFEEALRNILNNAVEAMKGAGTKAVHIRISHFMSRDKRWVKIEIRDSGCGIVKSEWDKVWELSYSTKSAKGGYGLFQARNMVEDCGGNIIIAKSELDKGTTVEINLPSA